MKYSTYIVTIRFAHSCKQIEVRAVDMQAALADVAQAYDNPEVIQVGCRA